MTTTLIDPVLSRFWCDDCQAWLPAPKRQLRARRRQHAAVHEHLHAKEGALA